MKLYLECMPCIISNITETVNKYVDNPDDQYKLIQQSIKSLDGHIYAKSSAPILTERYLEVIQDAVGLEDLYSEEKDIFNKEMLDLEGDFREFIRKSENQIETALILSGAANIIDFGIMQTIDKTFVKEKILEVLENYKMSKDGHLFIEELSKAKTLMYVGDNCGEIVLDKLVLENIKAEYPNIKIYYAVRSIPVLNDVTKEVALDIGIDEYAEIIESGATYPGTILSRCSPQFQSLYKNADVKILKGMGNVETAAQDEKEAYFVFMVKCKFFESKLKTKLHDVIISKGNPLYG
ncbi:MAG: DUF89 family protein [Firmicutes bacterium]|nr:DUF89 family protein [Bacillota bacterium]